LKNNFAFSRRPFASEPCRRPNKRTKAGRDRRQTAPAVGPLAVTIRRGKISSLRGAFATKQSRLCAADPGLRRRFAPRNDEKESGTPKDVFRNLRALTGAARPLRGAARLSAFHHGTCGRDRTPPLSSSHATSQDLFGAPVPMVRKTARIATHFYAQPANRLRLRHSRALPAPRNPSPARLHPQTGRDAGRRVSCPSRPGAKVTSLDPREPHSPRRPESPGRRPGTGARFALCTPSCDELSSARPLIGDGATSA
jgi:hypothetical protein